MAVPEGYELLARIGYVDRGNYSASATYLAGDVVYYNGSSWTALKDNLKGVTPVAGANWKYMARGFAAEMLSQVTAIDTSGLKGTAGAQVDAQALMDAVADRIANQLMKKDDLLSQIVNDATKAASMAALYSVNEELKRTNSNFPKHNNKILKWHTFGKVINSKSQTADRFSIKEYIASEVDIATVRAVTAVVGNGTINPVIVGVVQQPGNDWTIVLKEPTSGAFSILVAYLASE